MGAIAPGVARRGSNPWTGFGMVALALCGAASCQGQPDRSEGRASEPMGVVSLTPTLTSIVAGLGRADRLVGVTRWCPVEGIPIVGDLRTDLERVVAARPDLVIAGRYLSAAPDLAALRALGFRVLDLPLDSLVHTRRAMAILGERLDAKSQAEAMIGALDQALDDARRRASSRTGPAPRILLVFDVSDGMVYTTGGADHLGEVLQAVGAANVAQGGPKTARLSFERILQLAPDVIVHTAPTNRLPDREAALAFWQTLPSLPAVKRGAVHVWPDSSLATQGPQLAPAIGRLSRLLDPEDGP